MNNLNDDIKILEDETNALGLFFKCKGTEVYKRALENLLTRYKQLEEENKKIVQGKFREVADKNSYIKDMYISKSKIKEKIEELEENIKKSKPDDLMYIEYCEDRIQVLQELLKEK